MSAFVEAAKKGDLKRVKDLLKDGANPDSICSEIAKARAEAACRSVIVKIGDRTVSMDVTPVADTRYTNLYCRDITEQHVYQERTRSLAKFPDENPNPIMRIEGDGTILYANAPSAPLLLAWNSKVGGQAPAAVSKS